VVCGLGGPAPSLEPSVLTVGVFDGVHAGHRKLLGAVADRARREGLAAGAVTFDRHPLSVLRPELAPPMLTSLADRIELLGRAGMDWVAVVAFTRDRAAQTAEDFATSELFDRLRARVVLVGADFRFGNKAAGDLDLLQRLGAGRGIEASAVELQRDGGEVLSSTVIRKALADGDLATANRALGRPYSLRGRVGRGDGRGGAELGIPTANLRVPPGRLVPAPGVYAGRLHAPGAAGDGPLPEPAPAAISVGTNPTFDGTELRVEAHVLDAPPGLDLYDRRVSLTFEHRLRDQERYGSVEALLAQMRADVDDSRRLLR
jgi:riboflavin kinase/FMN adenylyltransferase